jgi:hypothetical protein
MNHVYEINVAKSNFREAYNAANVDRLLAAFADEFTDMTAGERSLFWRRRQVCGSVAHDEAS